MHKLLIGLMLISTTSGFAQKLNKTDVLALLSFNPLRNITDCEQLYYRRFTKAYTSVPDGEALTAIGFVSYFTGALAFASGPVGLGFVAGAAGATYGIGKIVEKKWHKPASLYAAARVCMKTSDCDYQELEDFAEKVIHESGKEVSRSDVAKLLFETKEDTTFCVKRTKANGKQIPYAYKDLVIKAAERII